jgi:transcriptional regulator with XRE-family HTH domain
MRHRGGKLELIAIGQFVASKRQQQSMTQLQLAEVLHVGVVALQWLLFLLGYWTQSTTLSKDYLLK